jgi:CRP-like cAMP-binding protein
MAIKELAGQDYSGMARAAGSVRRLTAGETLFRAGDAAEEMFVVLSGSVSILLDGRVIDSAGPGEGVGVLAMIDGTPRTADAVAAVDSEVVALDERRFRFVMENTPGFGWFVIGDLAKRLRAYQRGGAQPVSPE